MLSVNSIRSGALLNPISTDGKNVYPISSEAARGSKFSFNSIGLNAGACAQGTLRNLLIKWLITASTPAIGSTPFPSLYEFVSIKSSLSGNLATIAIAVIPFSISLSPASIKVSGFSIKPSLIPCDSDSITIPSGSFVKT